MADDNSDSDDFVMREPVSLESKQNPEATAQILSNKRHIVLKYNKKAPSSPYELHNDDNKPVYFENAYDVVDFIHKLFTLDLFDGFVVYGTVPLNACNEMLETSQQHPRFKNFTRTFEMLVKTRQR